MPPAFERLWDDDMSLSELEQHALAYYIATAAQDLTGAGRFFPYGEMVLIVEDKVQVATRQFGFKVTSKAKAVATAFLDHMIAKGGYSTTENKFGGKMHRFQAEPYREALDAMRAGDPIIKQASEAGPDFWKDAFARLTAS